MKCDRKLLAKLRESSKELLNQRLGCYLTNVEIDRLFRRDKIVKLFDSRSAHTGEA